MPDAKLAERILRLALARDRAAAIVGDLLEERRGWGNVVRVAAAAVWADLRRHPLQLTREALWTFGKTGLLFGLAANLATIFVIGAGAGPYIALLIGMRTLPFLYGGWDVVRRSRGCELAAAIPLAGLWLFVLVVAGRPPEAMHPFPYAEPAFMAYAPWFCIAAGALLYRVRSQRRLPGAANG
jgi:hypothetical protein